MSKESLTLEYKSSWRDEHLKAICAFANSIGGRLLVGVDDEGKAVGVPKIQKLLEDIPNKANEKLGILPTVSLKELGGVEVLEIQVNKQKMPISYNGKFYMRSGSTTQELNGHDLIEFISNKTGNTWDKELEPTATIDDLDHKTIEYFKKLAQKRAPFISKESDTKQLLEKLMLIENGVLTRAALLLFGKNAQRWSLSGIIRIGYFSSPTDLVATDEVSGNLFQQIDGCIDMLKKKYFKYIVTGYEGAQRQERLEYPEKAIREIVINSILHRDYQGVHSQFKIFDDYIRLWNPGELPYNLTIDQLKTEHNSYPRNPLIAKVFFFASLIESWGKGTLEIVTNCKESGFPEPIFENFQGGFQVKLLKDPLQKGKLKMLGLSERQIKAIEFIKQNGHITNLEYQELLNLSRTTAFRDLSDLVDKGIFVKKGTTGRDVTYSLSEPKI